MTYPNLVGSVRNLRRSMEGEVGCWLADVEDMIEQMDAYIDDQDEQIAELEKKIVELEAELAEQSPEKKGE